MQDITLATLAAFPDQLEAHFAAFPPALRPWKPPAWDGIPSEALTALEQVCHVRDIELDGYQRRFRRTLAEDRPLLGALDTDALVIERNYAQQDPAAMLAELRAARRETVSLLSALTPAQLDRPAVFEGYGPTTLRGLIHYLCSHDQQHLAGLQWLLGRSRR